MADTLEIFGTEYTGVTGIIATTPNETDLTYIRPQGTKSISANGTGIDVAEYASVDVSVPSGSPTLQTKTKTYTPTTSQQTESVTADSGYDGLDAVNVTVNAMPTGTAGTPTATKVVDTNDASALITPSVTNTTGYITGGTKTGASFYVTARELVSGNTVTCDDAGNWDVATEETIVVPSGTAGTPTATKGTVSNHQVSVTPSVTNTSGYITGSTKTGTAVTVSASELVSGTYTVDSSGTKDVTNYESISVASGSATAPASISGTAASVSTGTNTITLTKTVSVTPTVSAGYVSSGTAGNSSVSLTASVTTKAAATITPTTTNQTIAAGTYLTGTQTIAGDADLVAANIKKNVNIFGVTGSYEPDDFIVTLTQDSNENWIPDCTHAEADAAYNNGKTLTFTAGYPALYAGFGGYDDLGKTITYFVVEYFLIDFNDSGLNEKNYIWDYNDDINLDLSNVYHSTSNANAQPSDVVKDKVFYNANGYQVGTATGSTPTLQTKTKTYTPTETAQTESVTADSGYDGLDTVSISVGAISNTYVGTGITRRSSTDLTANGATVTVPSGYYSTQASKAVASGSATAPASISGTSATVTTGTNTLTLTKTISVTPVVSAGYVSSGTATNSSVSLTASVTTKAAATITPGTTNQTIASGTYLTGTQTIVGDADLVASNIVSGVQIFGVTGNVVLQNYYTGSSAPSSSTGSNGDLYLQS